MSSQVLSTQEDIALDAWLRLLRSSASMRRSLSAELDAAHGLAISDFEALLQLAHAEDSALRRVDLAEGLGLTASAVTRLLDGLERAGLVGKRTCEHDARVSYAVLTEDGRAKLAEASCSHVGAIRALFAERYSDEELRTLAELLERLPGAKCSTKE
ncbi:MAG TPA: MarR family winged helix-turn-helix transcriptional regulator [Gaiellaceae bacterium]|nr:MarR family winged helix-turn-helix transcriptional regulator [Gaiellaceae bacterium]